MDQAARNSLHEDGRFSPTTRTLIKQLAHHVAIQERCDQTQLDREISAVCALHHNVTRRFEAAHVASDTPYSSPDMITPIQSNISGLDDIKSLILAERPDKRIESHRRQFSFQPGDDTERPILVNAASQRLFENEPWKLASAYPSRSQKPSRKQNSDFITGIPHDSATEQVEDSQDQNAFSTELSQLQKANRATSGRSILTAIRDSSVRSSCSSRSGTPHNSFHGSTDRVEMNLLAKSAARVAGARVSFERKVEWSTGTDISKSN